MDKPTTIPELLDHVKALIQQDPRINTSRTNIESSTPCFATRSAPILPTSIPTVLPTENIPADLKSLSQILCTSILPNLNLSSLSPNYYGFVTGGATPAALLADILGSIYDQNVAVHLPSQTISTVVEVAALNLLVDMLRLPREEWRIGVKGCNGGGIITTGATASNIIGLGMGREFVLREAVRRRTGQSELSCGDVGILKMARLAEIDDVCVLSTLPHSSIGKAASIVGIGRENVISIAKSDSEVGLDIDIEKLERILRNAKKDRKAYILALSAGEVNTGRFATGGLDDMQQIRKICNETDTWVHVDGAFGLFGRMLQTNTNTSTNPTAYDQITLGLEGIELADSITSDGHKLLNVPYDCGLFFTRHKSLSMSVFGNGDPAYLKAAASATDGIEIQSPLNIGIENSRRFRALPVYATLTMYGTQGYIDMLQRQIGLARRIVAWIWKREGFEVLPVATTLEEAISKTFMIVLFRARDKELNDVLVERINADGKIHVTGTVWHGVPAVRIAVSNWQVNVERDGPIIETVLSEALEGSSHKRDRHPQAESAKRDM